jgi:hypothetical protein
VPIADFQKTLGNCDVGDAKQLQGFMSREMHKIYGAEQFATLINSAAASNKVATMDPARWLLNLLKVSVAKQHTTIGCLIKILVPLSVHEEEGGAVAGGSSRTDPESTMGTAAATAAAAAPAAAASETGAGARKGLRRRVGQATRSGKRQRG